MTVRPEQEVIDAIDALIDEQMAGGEIAAERRAEVTASEVDRCKLCNGAWHGSPWTGVDHDHLGEYDRHNHGRAMGCPGAFATGPQRIRYRRERMHNALSDRPYGNLIQTPTRRLVNGDPMSRYLRQVQAMNDIVQVLAEDDPALLEFQREHLSSWTRPISNLPPEVQFPRPQFVCPPFSDIGHLNDGSRVLVRPMGARGGEVRGPDAGASDSPMAWIDEAYTLDRLEQLRPRRGAPWLQQQNRDPWHFTIGETEVTQHNRVGDASPITLPKLYMVPSRAGRQSVTHRDSGRTLVRYWGAPQVAGTWWELDPGEAPWAELDITHEQDAPPRRRRSRGELPPPQRVFIELTTASGLHANPIGLIAVGDFAPGRAGTVRRAYLKSAGDHPPLLYGDERLTSARQPTSWRRCATSAVHPAHLVDVIREAEHL